jgi:hypothetical protein
MPPEPKSVYQQGHELVLAHLLRSGIGKAGSLPEARVLAEQKQAVPNHAARRDGPATSPHFSPESRERAGWCAHAPTWPEKRSQSCGLSEEQGYGREDQPES